MNEHHFKVDAPFASVVDALLTTSSVDVVEHSEIHFLGTLDGGAAVIARPAYINATDVIVAEPDGTSVVVELADSLARRLGCEIPLSHPFETV
jgi:hypothetical protein